MEAKTAKRRDYGPVQLSDYLGLARWQLERALTDGLIPHPDRNRGRWSADIAEAALARIDDIRAAAGRIPDCGAVRAAAELSKRLGIAVTDNGVAELGRQGLIPVAGDYKGWTLYDGRALETFKDTFSVPLYRTGDLDALARRDDIDWDTVRSTRKGHRSPLAKLPTADRNQKG